MIVTLAIHHYRSIRELILPLGRLNLITGANGAGKSNLYRSLRLLADAAHGQGVKVLTQEGGLDSILWAGPESFNRDVKAGKAPPQGGPRQSPTQLRVGFCGDTHGYAIDFGIPTPVPRTLFTRDPEIKREVIWHGDKWHPRRALVDRKGGVVKVRDEQGAWQILEQHLPSWDSMLSRVSDSLVAPEAPLLRDALRAWRFYDHFRCDSEAPARAAQIGVRTTALANDGRDLAAAWRTIEEIGDDAGLASAVSDAFPGARVSVNADQGRFELQFEQGGLLRPLTQRELSDGTLRYLLLIAALLTPRPPPLMVLNEPESSLHPDLLPPLARLMRRYANEHQLWVVSHATALQEVLLEAGETNHIELDKDLGETFVHGQDLLNTPSWAWPTR